MAYQVILFDIDGTLCDPGNSITESAKYALAQLGIHETDETALRRFVGPPLEHSFRDYYGFDQDKTRQAVIYFREKLQNDGLKLYTAYPGISELLETLRTANKTSAIVTSKIEHIALDALKNTDLLPYFDVIGAQQPFEVVEKEVILGRVLERLQVTDKSQVIMVGDRKHDIEAAKVHDIDSVGVLWGYGPQKEFTDEGATHTTHSAEELSALLLQP